jgi:hypothetical protein
MSFGQEDVVDIGWIADDNKLQSVDIVFSVAISHRAFPQQVLVAGGIEILCCVYCATLSLTIGLHANNALD